jgi:hypothetical protein
MMNTPKTLNTLRTLLVCTVLLGTAAAATADPVLDWNAIAVATAVGNPFNQARILAITHLAMFEAVNAIQGGYEPYLGTIVAPAGASAEAAAIAAAHDVLKFYFPGSAAMLDAAQMASLSAITDANAKAGGIATGQAAAAAMIAARVNDGSAPPEFYLPSSTEPYQWQLTPGCTPAGGQFMNWPKVKPFGIADAGEFVADPPPALTSNEYAKAFDEVKRVGRDTSTERPQDRTDVARFYAGSSPAYVINMAARQISAAQGRSLAHNARAFALINMAINDAAVVSFTTKYQYTTWRPETAIHNADVDGNDKTDADATWKPLIVAPCFPSYTSNHGSLSNAGAEVLRRLYGAGGHTISITNRAFPTLAFQYSELKDITSDIADARVYGGIHFRFDQDAGGVLGRAVGTEVYKNQLRKIDQPQ